MSIESTVLITDQTIGTFVSDKQKAAGYHRRHDVLHTIILSFSNFTGSVQIQATLELYPGENDWFDCVLTDANGDTIEFDSDSTDRDGDEIANTEGNFVWMRAVGTVSAGVINQIRYNY